MLNDIIIQHIKHHRIWQFFQLSDSDKKAIMDKIIAKFDKYQFDTFIKNYHGYLSPNIYTENLIFSTIFQELNHKDFDFYYSVDLKSVIATSNSFIQRPNIIKPSEVINDFKEPDLENSFIRMARFESQIVLGDYRKDNKKFIVFEGLLLHQEKINPLFDWVSLPSQRIWDNNFLYGYPIIQVLSTQMNSINFPYILWINSSILRCLRLVLDDYNNGLQALDCNGEIIIKFRCWRENLIDNGNDGNIPTLEGCDLMIRKDYYDKLKAFIPDMVFYSEILA
ncbi:hypothetical protein [Mannheimia bovis]|uniref:Uncharacterized protein n=1 Tax=Mannheimia bovis TaxID=2770636 RepID=A0A7H1C0B2_9PAST|nr:hypothetical protein [Mannheimia bovis]QNS14417.1 hypothetical protein ICJ55_06515 [Mannheimia bovis]